MACGSAFAMPRYKAAFRDGAAQIAGSERLEPSQL
jgi:hypothetical protein